MRAAFFNRAAIGFLLGIVVGSAITWLTGGDGRMVSASLAAWAGSETAAVLIQLLASGLLGAGSMVGTLLYQIERWPLALCSVTHFLVIAGLYVAAALLLGWVGSLRELLFMLGLQLIAYVIVWLIMALRCKAQVRKLNEIRENTKRQKPEP